MKIKNSQKFLFHKMTEQADVETDDEEEEE